MSKLVTLNAAGDAATVAEATIGDLFSTLFSQDKAVTGVYALVRTVLLVLLGMSAESYFRADTFKPKLFGG